MPIILKWIESTDKSEEAATEVALQKLGMDRGEISVEILERAESGFLNIKSCSAKVKVSYETPDESEEHPTPAEITHAGAEPVKTAKPIIWGEAPYPATPVAERGKTGRINTFLANLLTQMGVEARPVIHVNENGTYQMELVDRELGSLVGRRGETLSAIRQPTGYVVNHGQPKWARIHVGTEGCRTRRKESLVHPVQKVAGKVVGYRRNITLEPMDVYEHSVIHTVLRGTPSIIAYSIDAEPNRHTVVAYGRGGHR